MKRLTEIQTGMLIDYRGFPALVVCYWSPEGGEKPRGIPEPYGMELEWTDELGTTQHTRVVWPELSAAEKDQLDFMPEASKVDMVSQRLGADIERVEIKLWSD